MGLPQLVKRFWSSCMVGCQQCVQEATDLCVTVLAQQRCKGQILALHTCHPFAIKMSFSGYMAASAITL